MKISVVTLSFNQSRFLEFALKSVLEQSYENLEYIVVDPGSNDASDLIIDRYRDRLSAVIQEPDRGAADGLNKGFARATGEIFAFLNADDLLLPGSLQTVSNYFTANPHCDIVFGAGYIVDEHGMRMRHIKPHGFTVRRYLHGGARWLQQATFFRRSTFLRSPGFNIANRTCWDGELLVEMVRQGAQVAYLREDLAEFRLHGSSISGSGSNQARYQEDQRRIFTETLNRQWSVFDEALRSAYRFEGLIRRFAKV